jgi:hypothetical protein
MLNKNLKSGDKHKNQRLVLWVSCRQLKRLVCITTIGWQEENIIAPIITDHMSQTK